MQPPYPRLYPRMRKSFSRFPGSCICILSHRLMNGERYISSSSLIISYLKTCNFLTFIRFFASRETANESSKYHFCFSAFFHQSNQIVARTCIHTSFHMCVIRTSRFRNEGNTIMRWWIWSRRISRRKTDTVTLHTWKSNSFPWFSFAFLVIFNFIPSWMIISGESG